MQPWLVDHVPTGSKMLSGTLVILDEHEGYHQDTIPKLDYMGLCNSLSHVNQSLQQNICLPQTFMGPTLKLLQSAKFLGLNSLIIGL